jgi:hypothetical protein
MNTIGLDLAVEAAHKAVVIDEQGASSLLSSRFARDRATIEKA